MNYFLGNRRLWVFDFDGTISHIVPDRNVASLDAECGKMLRTLQSNPWNRVAVISSRSLDDIVPRVILPGLIVGGGSGLEWVLPGGFRASPDLATREHLETNRKALRPLLREIGAIPGVEIEDKKWSVAVHHRNASPRSFRKRMFLLQKLRNRAQAGIRVYRGHEVAEVQLVRGGSKASGLDRLCRLIGWNVSPDGLFYAGDDENDATAMKWVLSRGGTAVVVGPRISLPSAPNVESPADLPSAVHAHSRNNDWENRPWAKRTACG
ncbi:MAG: trehalose-phosphatase [bacterium]|nr:trehalose-phosphatase [bacterium]